MALLRVFPTRVVERAAKGTVRNFRLLSLRSTRVRALAIQLPPAMRGIEDLEDIAERLTNKFASAEGYIRRSKEFNTFRTHDCNDMRIDSD